MRLTPIDGNCRALLEILKSELFGLPVDIMKSEHEWAEIYKESMYQAVQPFVVQFALRHKSVADAQLAEWKKIILMQVLFNEKLMYCQNEIIEAFERENIRYAILKGTSVCVFYPEPVLRTQGDIDMLIRPEDFAKAHSVLERQGFRWWQLNLELHEVFSKADIRVEPHYSLADIPEYVDKAVCDTTSRDIFSALTSATLDSYHFSVLSDRHQALSLLLHMKKHLTHDCVGLRQLCDWALFLHKRVSIDTWCDEIRPLLITCGLYRFAQVVTKACIRHLGLDSVHLSWCEETDERVCHEFMALICRFGNMGRKKNNIFAIKMLSLSDAKYDTRKTFFKTMISNLNRIINRDFPWLRYAPFLYPLFWLYVPLRYYVLMLCGKRQTMSMIDTIIVSKHKRMIYDNLQLFETVNNGKG